MTSSIELMVNESLQSVFDRYIELVPIFQKINGVGPTEPLAPNVSSIIEHRTVYTGWKPTGVFNASGSCRFVSTLDERWVAVHLARPSDAELLGIILDLPQLEWEGDGKWTSIELAISRRTADDLATSTDGLGLPLSFVGEIQWPGPLNSLPVNDYRVNKSSSINNDRHRFVCQVVDLSSLWAGPLCSRLLMSAGFEVTTIESRHRPDLTRLHHPDFYDDLHRNKKRIVLDFDHEADRRHLRELLESCDVVITGCRRRAIDHLGIDIDRVLATSRPAIWVSLTGYGYQGPYESRVGFGDDCAVAGGLLTWETREGRSRPAFLGDAQADPVTGLVAATAVLEAAVDRLSTTDLDLNVASLPAHHLQIALAECASWVARGGRVTHHPRDWTNEGRLEYQTRGSRLDRGR
jgi:hypothetical protein